MKGKCCAKSDNHDSEQGLQMDSSHSESEAGTGDLLWVKLGGGSWWPALVVDEDTVSGSSKPGNKSIGDVLVRLYGSYEYLYVDPIEHRSEFEIVCSSLLCMQSFVNVGITILLFQRFVLYSVSLNPQTLKENNGSYREIFAKALEQDFSHAKSGRSRGPQSKSKGAPTGQGNASYSKKSNQSHKRLKLNSPSHEEVVEVKNCRQNGFQSILKLDSPTATGDAKCKSPAQNEGNSFYGRAGELSVRRMKVMQALGLTPPSGSPFKKNEHICLSL
uniref:Uncharacterized protein LOC103319536 n=1 Tax=Rhizophora mucronata TaxID=61149 RepID=A0A2P2JWI0_RHIMU